MTRNTILAATAVAVMAGTALGADYSFPSANPPGGKAPSEVPQYISFIWDDNGYSGELGSIYEPKTGEVKYADYGYVGGMQPNWDNQGGLKAGGLNPLNIMEGDMGLSWAVKTFGAKIKSKGTGHMTFNMISGLFIPAWGPEWDDRESEYGFTKDDQAEHKRIAISWGREQLLGKVKGGAEAQKSYMVEGVKKMIAAGHEIGNHTVDHIETNSIWPKSLWANSNLDGFDPSGTDDMIGGTWDEKGAGYSDSTAARGWMKYAGKKLELATWEGIIALGEVDGPKQGISEKLNGFRAPRLEINSNMFSALANKGYTYDCGVEEGMEESVDGTNFLWPYTVDNGVPNFTSQMLQDEPIYATSFPVGKGLWEIPVNLMIVPEDIRDAVLEGHNKLVVDGEGGTAMPMSEWSGKVTGFDFNMFILWAMTKEQVVTTMNHTLDLHYDNNRAPMQVGCHTDYFTPMYDNATLDKDGAFKYALPTYNTGHGNTWVDRKVAFEAFADYAASKSDVEFVSGIELIEGIRALQSGETFGDPHAMPSSISWEFMGDPTGSTDESSSSSAGDELDGKIALGNGDDAYASYNAYINEGSLDGLTHLSMTYNANTALAVRIYVEGDLVKGADYNAAWEVIVNNKDQDVQSGKIPVSAFKYGEYSQGEKESLDVAKIIAIEIAPLESGKTCEFAISDFTTYGAEAVGGGDGGNTGGPVDKPDPDDAVEPDEDADAIDYPETATWDYSEDNNNSVDVADASTFVGNAWDGEITMNAETDTTWAYASYVSYDDAGYLDGLTHLAITHKSNEPIEVHIYVEGDNVKDADYQAAWEFPLDASSSFTTDTLDLLQFAYDQYGKGEESSINSAKINGIGIAPQGAGKEHVFSIKDLKTFGVEATALGDVAPVTKSSFALQSISNGALNLTVPTAGVYSVNLFSANGRLVKSLNNSTMTTGMNSVNVSDLSSGVYMLRVIGANTSLTAKALIK